MIGKFGTKKISPGKIKFVACLANNFVLSWLQIMTSKP